MRTYTKGLALMAGLFLIGLLAGCGGGAVSELPASGSIRVTIRFPESSRLIPANTRAVKLVLLQNGAARGQAIVTREQGTAHYQFTGLASGTYTLMASAHPDPNATSAATARGAVEAIVRPGETTQVALTLASTVQRIQVMRVDNTPIAPGATFALQAIGLNAQHEMVLLSEGKQRWSSSDPAVATVNSQGVVTVVGTGEVTIQVYDEESERIGVYRFTATAAGGSGGSSGTDTGVTLSPGEWIVLSRLVGSTQSRLVAVPPSNPNAIVNLPPPPANSVGDKYVAYSPGSDYLVFARILNNAEMRLMSLNWRTGTLHELASGLLWPVFSTDGETVVFGMKVGGQWDLYEVAIDGGGLRPLTQTSANEYDPAIAPDGRTIVFTRDHRLMEMDRNSGAVTALPNSSYDLAFFPQYTPDGAHIAFVGRQNGVPSLQVLVNRASPRTVAGNVVRFAFTPSGQILYTVLNNDGMWLVNANGSGSRRVTALSPKLGFAVAPSAMRAVACDSAFNVRLIDLNTGADTPFLNSSHHLPIWVNLGTRSFSVAGGVWGVDALRDWQGTGLLPNAYEQLLRSGY